MNIDLFNNKKVERLENEIIDLQSKLEQLYIEKDNVTIDYQQKFIEVEKKYINQKNQEIKKIKDECGLKISQYEKECNDKIASCKLTSERFVEQQIESLNSTKQTLSKEVEDIRISYQQKTQQAKKDYETKMQDYRKRAKLLSNKEEVIESIINHELNKSMKSVYSEVIEGGLDSLKKFFEEKKNPSKKASEFVSEFKQYIKELEVDNRKLRLALSRYVDGIEGYNEVVQMRRLEGLKQYNSLTEQEKRELKLKREIERQKDQLEIGLAFERYYGYLIEQEGFSVNYWGIKRGVQDGGIDLVAKKGKKTTYVQCKYWSKNTVIRENTVSQLYGSSLNMYLQNGGDIDEFNKLVKKGDISMVLATHTVLSEEAKNFAKLLGIKYVENIEMQEYPMVKLVDGENKIYYIPTDEQYDEIIYNSTSKKYSRCKSCEEAEELGYRGAKRWLGFL